ncbi:hypothetical protein BBP40_009064, partial [Aspergillus hancockii]
LAIFSVMAVSQLLASFLTLWFTHRIYLIVYRLYFHRLAEFPGPRLAAISTIYRSFFQIWKNGKLIDHVTTLHDLYGPVVRISPNEVSESQSLPIILHRHLLQISHLKIYKSQLHFRNIAAYHDIYSARFEGTKDPDFYEHLGQSAALFGIVDPKQHSARFRIVSHLFSKRHFDSFEPRLKAHVTRFGDLLSVLARNDDICNLSFGFRSVALDIVNDFIFGGLSPRFRQLKDETFMEPLTLATHYAMDWRLWLSRNFPTIFNIIQKLPSSLVLSITPAFEAGKTLPRLVMEMVEHALASGAKDWHNHFFYCIAYGLENLNTSGGDSPPAVLVDEVKGTMLGGVIDIANILPYGAFQVSQDPILQDLLFEELRGGWAHINDPVPVYETLSRFPILNGVVKESLRLTYGVISGPPRLVGKSGAVVDGYQVPPGCVVTTTSVYVHMDPKVFSNPEKFDPLRWQGENTKQMENAIVAFSKGRRMCPARYMAYMEMFSIFATLFRRFQVTPYKSKYVYSIDAFPRKYLTYVVKHL